MRILHIYDEYFPPEKGYTTPWKYAVTEAGYGHEVYVICGRRVGELRRESIDGVEIIRTPNVLIWGRRLDSFGLLFLMLSNLKLLRRIDVAHVYYFFLSPIVHVFLRLISVPAICDIRSVPIKSTTIGRFLRLLATALADRSAAISIGVVDWLQPSYRSREFFVFPLGIDAVSIELDDVRFYDGNIVQFISVGSMDAQRRQEDLLHAFDRCLKITKDIRLTVVGVGNNQHQFVDLIERLNLDDYVRCFDYIPHHKVLEMLSEAHVGVCYLPIAVFDVQPPTKTLEYISANLIVLGSLTRGNTEICSDYEGRCILVQDNVESLVVGMLDAVSAWRNKPCLSSPDVRKHEWASIVLGQVLPAYEETISS